MWVPSLSCRRNYLDFYETLPFKKTLSPCMFSRTWSLVLPVFELLQNEILPNVLFYIVGFFLLLFNIVIVRLNHLLEYTVQIIFLRISCHPDITSLQNALGFIYTTKTFFYTTTIYSTKSKCKIDTLLIPNPQRLLKLCQLSKNVLVQFRITCYTWLSSL